MKESNFALNLENFRIKCILCSECLYKDHNKIMAYTVSTDNPSPTCQIIEGKVVT